MYASPSAPAAAREPYAGVPSASSPAPGDAAPAGGPRAAAAVADADSIAPQSDQIADGAGSIPGSPMQGMLAVFGDFLRAAFEQLGQMLAGLVAGGNGAPPYGGPPPGPGGPPGYAGAPGFGGDSGSGDGGPARFGANDVAGADVPAPPGGGETGAAHGRRHAHREHVRRRDAGADAGPLLPGRSLDLGQGESIRRTRDGSLQITIGTSQTPVQRFTPPPEVDSTLPGGLL